MDDLTHWLALSLLHNLSAEKLLPVLAEHNSLDQLINGSSSTLELAGIRKDQQEALKQPDMARIEQMLAWQQQANNHVITILDERYPEQLKNIDTPPLLLFAIGDPDYLKQPQIAMVGSRSPTAAGKQTAEDFAEHLSNNGITITSGLARGIDGASHRGALRGIAGTVAVCAQGLDRVYPAEHRELAHQIAANGCLISEQPLGVSPQPGLFPLRNRIISGLSLGVLVVEAAIRSGTLITARHALEQNIEVFAIPGSIHNPAAKGCHALIKQGAKLVETADDILEELQILVKIPASGDTTRENPAKEAENIDPDYQKLLDCMGYDPVTIDTLIECTGLTAAQLASMLLILELQGDVATTNGRYHRLKP